MSWSKWVFCFLGFFFFSDFTSSLSQAIAWKHRRSLASWWGGGGEESSDSCREHSSLSVGMAGLVCSVVPSYLLEVICHRLPLSSVPPAMGLPSPVVFPSEPRLWHFTDVLRVPSLEHMGTPSSLLHKNVWFIHLLGGVDYTNNVLCHKFQPCSCQYLFESLMPYH